MLKEKSSPLEDEEIIELYWQRKENAIFETDNKYGEVVFRIAYNILNDKGDSEECQNDTYLDVWNAIPPARLAHFWHLSPKLQEEFLLIYIEKEATKKPFLLNSKSRLKSLNTACN